MSKTSQGITIVVLIAFVLWVVFWIVGGFNPWLRLEKPPTLPDAQDITESFVRNTDDGQDRQTAFTSNMSKAEIQAFYRSQLLSQGWSEYDPRAVCGEALWPRAEWYGIFHKNKVQLTILSRTTEDNTSTEVTIWERVNKSSFGAIEAIQYTPLQRHWISTASNDQAQYVLCFEPNGGVQLAHDGEIIMLGPYQAQGDTVNIELKVEKSGQEATLDKAFCNDLPQIFAEHCTIQVIDYGDPSAYPGYVPAQGRPGYPAPSVNWRTIHKVQGDYHVTINQDQLILTSASGASQSFVASTTP